LASNVTLIEPGAYATEFASPSSLKRATGMDVYSDLRRRMASRLSAEERGDPKATAEAILRIVDAEDPPLRFALGGAACCLWRAPLMKTALRPGRPGRLSRMRLRAKRIENKTGSL
jgi:hypothetical protein